MNPLYPPRLVPFADRMPVCDGFIPVSLVQVGESEFPLVEHPVANAADSCGRT